MRKFMPASDIGIPPIPRMSHSEPTATVDVLPNEVLDIVFHSLYIYDKEHLWSCVLVSRRWHDLAIRYLWRKMYFASDPNERLYYQNPLFKILEVYPKVWSGFCNTKQLTLEFSNNGFPISTKAQCVSILTEFERMQFVMHWAAPYVNKLKLELEPFIEEDVDDDSLWPLLEHGNRIIQHVVTVASTVAQKREISLSLTIGRPHWRFHSSSRRRVEEIISILGPYLTELDLSDPSVLECTRLVSQAPKLQGLQLMQVSHENLASEGLPPSVIWGKLWERLCDLPLRSLFLSGSDLRLLNLHGSIANLHDLLLDGVENAANICQIILTELRHLRYFIVKNERGGSGDIQKVVFKGPLASKEIRVVNLFNIVAPIGVISAISEVSDHLFLLLLPKNATDQDVQSLMRLRLLETMDAIGCDNLTLQYLVVISQIRQLRNLRCSWSHLAFLTQEILFKLARGCPTLDEIGFNVYNARLPEKTVVPRAQNWVPGPGNYKRWLKSFMAVRREYGCYFMWINLDRVRDDHRYRIYLRGRHQERVIF